MNKPIVSAALTLWMLGMSAFGNSYLARERQGWVDCCLQLRGVQIEEADFDQVDVNEARSSTAVPFSSSTNKGPRQFIATVDALSSQDSEAIRLLGEIDIQGSQSR